MRCAGRALGYALLAVAVAVPIIVVAVLGLMAAGSS
jgi:hypothetical protein